MKLSGERPTTNGINPTLGTAPKRYAARFYQLKVGNGVVGTFLARICWWCVEAEQSVENFYTKCRRRRNKGEKKNGQRTIHRQKKVYSKMLRNEGGWQGC